MLKEISYIHEEGVWMRMCDLCKCVFTLSEGQPSGPQLRAFLPGHQKEHKNETLRRNLTFWENVRCHFCLTLRVREED